MLKIWYGVGSLHVGHLRKSSSLGPCRGPSWAVAYVRRPVRPDGLGVEGGVFRGMYDVIDSGARKKDWKLQLQQSAAVDLVRGMVVKAVLHGGSVDM
jgi:hypothetical protein